MKAKASKRIETIQKSKQTLQEVKKGVIISKKEFLETHTPDHSDLEKRIRTSYCDISRLKRERNYKK